MQLSKWKELDSISIFNYEIKKNTEEFLNSLDVSDNSKETYTRQLRSFFRWLVRNNIDMPNEYDMLNFKKYLLYNRTLKASTASLYLICLRKYFTWLEIRGQYSNITRGLKVPKFNKNNLKDCLTKNEARKLLTSITSLRDFAIINLMVRTGLRVVEVTRINLGDIQKDSDKILLYIQGKGRLLKDEYVVLTEATLKPIIDYLVSKNIDLYNPNKAKKPLFASESTKNAGYRLTTRSVSRIVKDCLNKIGITSSRITAHSLRHTSITLGLLAGVTPQQMMHFARHKSLETTMIYAHNINRVKEAPEYKIDEFLDL